MRFWPQIWMERNWEKMFFVCLRQGSTSLYFAKFEPPHHNTDAAACCWLGLQKTKNTNYPLLSVQQGGKIYYLFHCVLLWHNSFWFAPGCNQWYPCTAVQFVLHKITSFKALCCFLWIGLVKVQRLVIVWWLWAEFTPICTLYEAHDKRISLLYFWISVKTFKGKYFCKQPTKYVHYP